MYPEQSTENFNNVTNINVVSDNITPQKKNGREEYCQEDRQIPFNKKEENKSIISRKTIEPNARKTIEPNAIEKIEPNESNKMEKLRANKRKSQEIRKHLTLI